MIGRFARLGAYRELLGTREVLACAAGGGLALASALWGKAGLGPAWGATALALGSVAVNGLPIIMEAAKGLYRQRMNVDELVSLAIVASLLQGEALTAAVVSFIMTAGSLAEEAVSETARRSIQALAKMTPEEATLLTENGERTVRASEVQVGDRLIVRPGDRVPVDGIIVSGESAVDESTVTGEPIPRVRRKGDPAMAGTLNYNGVLKIRATHVGSDTTLGRVVRLVTEAEAHKPVTARFVDSWAKWFTPVVLSLAWLAWVMSGEPGRAVAVLVAGCPCALLMAAPTATVAAVARAARAGILVKGGRHLEEAARADAVLFDKTGTLTLGRPRVEEVVPADGQAASEVLACAAGAERDCAHPLARAVLDAASRAKVAVGKAEDVLSEIGLGVRAMLEGRLVEVGSPELMGGAVTLPIPMRKSLEAIEARGSTPLVVRRDQSPIGILSVSDTVRDSALRTVFELKGLGVRQMGILSGDHDRSVRRVATEVGLDGDGDGAWARLKPEGKLAVIQAFRRQGRRVMFVGDGVNDAPALAGANIGVAMGAAGSEVALETAGIALTQDDVSRLPFLIRLARRMLSIIKANVCLGLLFNALAVFGGSSGALSPIGASLVHNTGSILVVLSSASLVMFRDGRTPEASAQPVPPTPSEAL